MPSIVKPLVAHPSLARNELGLTIRDYEGTMSTLCAGCGHDSITAAIIRALWELSTPPHVIAKLSGIGCSSKTPTYFVSGAHGFNSAHGRMPAIATGANAANRELTYIGVSGDGDSLSIGLGHLCHAMRRNLQHAVRDREQRRLRTYQRPVLRLFRCGLEEQKGRGEQDVAHRSRAAWLSAWAPPSWPAVSRATRSNWCPSSRPGSRTGASRIVDVISPCVTFNDHEGSTKSYKYTRGKQLVRDRIRLRAARPRNPGRDRPYRRDQCHHARWQRAALHPGS